MKNDNLLIVNSKILPPIFKGVIEAKELLAKGEAKNTSEAVKIVGISRSAFYKYKDYVFRLEDSLSTTLTLNAVLCDKAGVFSALTQTLYEKGANIITVNQGAPQNGTAPVTLTVCTDNVKISLDALLDELRATEGIISIKSI